MPTDEERREVAVKLRDMAARANPSWPVLMEALGTPVRAVTVMYLADLIDPADGTCELELTWGGHTNAHVRTYECSRCGKSCDSVWGRGLRVLPLLRKGGSRMPTNDERRKIAAELRENRDPLTPYNLVDYIFDDPWNHDSGGGGRRPSRRPHRAGGADVP